MSQVIELYQQQRWDPHPTLQRRVHIIPMSQKELTQDSHSPMPAMGRNQKEGQIQQEFEIGSGIRLFFYELDRGVQVGHLTQDLNRRSSSKLPGNPCGLGLMWLGASLAHHPLDPNTAGVLAYLQIWVLCIEFRFFFVKFQIRSCY